mmetsp:Transcript_42035/g.51732  ORF Transcript_42035/g.51732 Transcript_42035/m.51732 type:complete len:292 (-) Transcript_42035:255-1130(-)
MTNFLFKYFLTNLITYTIINSQSYTDIPFNEFGSYKVISNDNSILFTSNDISIWDEGYEFKNESMKDYFKFKSMIQFESNYVITQFQMGFDGESICIPTQYSIKNGDESYQVNTQINGWDIGSYIRLDDTPINVYKDEFIIVELIFDNGCNSSMWIGGCNNTQLRGNIMSSNTGNANQIPLNVILKTDKVPKFKAPNFLSKYKSIIGAALLSMIIFIMFAYLITIFILQCYDSKKSKRSRKYRYDKLKNPADCDHAIISGLSSSAVDEDSFDEDISRVNVVISESEQSEPQ